MKQTTALELLNPPPHNHKQYAQIIMWICHINVENWIDNTAKLFGNDPRHVFNFANIQPSLPGSPLVVVGFFWIINANKCNSASCCIRLLFVLQCIPLCYVMLHSVGFFFGSLISHAAHDGVALLNDFQLILQRINVLASTSNGTLYVTDVVIVRHIYLFLCYFFMEILFEQIFQPLLLACSYSCTQLIVSPLVDVCVCVFCYKCVRKRPRFICVSFRDVNT